MSEPAHYVTSDYYRPGFMSEVGMAVAAILAIVLLFVLSTIAARYLLLSKRRFSPGTRRLLEIFASLGKPASGGRSRRRRRSSSSSRADQDQLPQYVLKGAEGGAPERSAALKVEMPQVSGSAAPRRRAVRDLAPSPEEAWPTYAEDEIEAAIGVLRSGKVNQWTGSKVFELERAYTRSLRNGRAIALANGSVALELALKAHGVGPGDEVIVTPRTFVASAFCAQLVGATPVFADVDRDSGNITAESISRVLTPRTRAVIPVHLGGWPADMPAIAELAREKGILLIEDCAQAHGAEIDGLPVGSFGDAAAFSFCQDKIITTAGEGGLVALRDDEAYEFAWSFKDHGKNRSRALERPNKPGFRWLHDQVGTNWRMTEISAAIGLLQLDKLPGWRSRRTANAQIWAEALGSVKGLRVPLPPRNLTGAFYKFYAYVDVDPAENRVLRDRILERAGEAGLRVFSGSCSEVYLEKAFEDLRVEPLPIAHELGESSLMMEVHPTLDPRRLRDRADAFADIVDEVLRRA